MSDDSNELHKEAQRSPSTSNLTDDQISAIAEDFEKTAFAHEHVARIKSTSRHTARPESDLATTRD